MRIEPRPESGPDLLRWCEIFDAGRVADSGGPAGVAGLVARPPRIGFAAYDGSRVVGVATGKDDGFTRVYVPAGERRRGAGRALVAAVASQATTDTLRGIVVEGGPGEAFVSSLGATVLMRLVTVERRLDAPAPEVAAPAELEMLRWSDRCPEEFLADYARLRQAVGDAPGAHLQFDASVRDAAWVREWERQRTEGGGELWVGAAVHNGRLVAFTEVEVPSLGDASQHDTAVLPEWRGNGVATWLKADMIERLRRHRPVVGRLTSTISEENAAMLAVSRRLGYREAWRRLMITIPVPEAST